MKHADVVVGQTYLTRIGGELARVVVVNAVIEHTYTHRYTAMEKCRTSCRFRLRREGVATLLPKTRTAAALHPVGGS